MNVSQEEFQNMKDEITKDLITFRIEDTGPAAMFTHSYGKNWDIEK